MLHRWAGDRSAIRALAIAPDGSWIASAGQDGLIRVWRTETGEQLYALRGDDAGGTDGITVLAVAPDGGWLAAAGEGESICLWDMTSGEPRALPSKRYSASTLAVIRTENLLVSGGKPVSLPPTLLKGNAEASGGALWECHGQEPRAYLPPEINRHIYTLVADPRGQWLAATGFNGIGCQYNNLSVLDLHSGKARVLAKGEKVDPTGPLAVAPDGRWLAASDGRHIRLWQTHRGWRHHIVLKRHPLPAWVYRRLGKGEIGFDPGQLSSPIHALAAGPDGAWIAAAYGVNKICIWDIETGRLLYRPVGGGARTVCALAVDPRGRWLFSAGGDGLVHRWVLDPTAEVPVCDRAMQVLSDDDWVVWEHPNDEGRRRWAAHSSGARQWLGWHEPRADGTGWAHRPLDAD